MKFLATCLLIALGCHLAGCAKHPRIYEKNGKLYGTTKGLFSFTWWDYFERGDSLAQGGFHEEAVPSFEEAISQRDADQWRARKYGMHFVDYFPHRELGIVYYRMGLHEKAVGELETSLRQAESAKAKYFLNLARKALIEGAGADALPPELLLDTPAADVITGDFAIELSGVARDDTLVAGITIDEKPLPLELAAPQVPFRRAVGLREGANDIIISVEDITGKKTGRTTRIVSDRQGPVIAVSGLEGRDGSIVLRFSVADLLPIDRISLNERGISVTDDAEAMDLVEEVSKGPIVIQAWDRAGNMTRAELSPGEAILKAAPFPLLASLDAPSSATESHGLLPVRESPPSLLAWFGSGRKVDGGPPIIVVRGLVEGEETYAETVRIEVELTDESGIASLAINGEEVLTRGGKKAFFSTTRKLRPGENRFSMEARDADGNTGVHSFSMTRKVHPVRQLGSRMSIALLPLEKKGDPSWITDAVDRRLASVFVNQERFHIVAREELEAILLEHDLVNLDLADPEKAISLGRVVSADSLLAGTILETGDAVEIVTYLVDTETTRIIAANDVYDEDKTRLSLTRLLERLAHKYESDFPLLEGMIIEIQDRGIFVNLGRKDRLRTDMKLLCFREGSEMTSRVTGESLGRKVVELGAARIVNVAEASSMAEVTRHEGEILIEDKVITK